MGKFIQFFGAISFALSQVMRMLGGTHEKNLELSVSCIGMMLMGIIFAKAEKKP